MCSPRCLRNRVQSFTSMTALLFLLGCAILSGNIPTAETATREDRAVNAQAASLSGKHPATLGGGISALSPGHSTALWAAFNWFSHPLNAPASMMPLAAPTTPSFGAATNFAAGGERNSIATGDFNGDGKRDLAVVDNTAYNLSILLGNGAGAFGAAVNYPLMGGIDGLVEVDDFNRDGKNDLAVAFIHGDASFPASKVAILLGDGAGGFSAPVYFPAGDYVRDIESGILTRHPFRHLD